MPEWELKALRTSPDRALLSQEALMKEHGAFPCETSTHVIHRSTSALRFTQGLNTSVLDAEAAGGMHI